MESPAPKQEMRAPTTPGSIYLAIFLLLIAIAAPFIGEYQATHASGDSWDTLRVLLKWLSISAAAAIGGIVSTIVGARRGAPFTLLTKVAMVLCVLMALSMAVFFSGGL